MISRWQKIVRTYHSARQMLQEQPVPLGDLILRVLRHWLLGRLLVVLEDLLGPVQYYSLRNTSLIWPEYVCRRCIFSGYCSAAESIIKKIECTRLYSIE